VNRRAACLVALLSATPALAADDGASGWIGRIVPPYPDGVVETTGTCIGDATVDVAAICDHAVAVLDD
jgi:hypothetical protein